MKERLDKLLLARGLVTSRQRARALIIRGAVLVNDQPQDKPGTMIATNASIRITGQDIPYVSRGGLKLAAALTEFEVTVTGKVALDVGASTGGFTDCLLQFGAQKVYALDVGYGQLAWKLRQDPRVVVMERTNIRYVTAASFTEKIALATVDVSFISLSKVIPVIVSLLIPEGDIIALVKPQFEVGRGEVGKGGIVTSAEKHREVLKQMLQLAAELKLNQRGLIPSPILGAQGNREFLLHLRGCCPNTIMV